MNHSFQQIYCSRYVNQHMLLHTQNTNHPIVLSFYDISMWCYGCDDFVDHSVSSENIQILDEVQSTGYMFDLIFQVLQEPRDHVIYAKYGSPTEGLTDSMPTK